MFQNLGMESTAAPVRAAGPGVSVARLPGGLLAGDVLERLSRSASGRRAPTRHIPETRVALGLHAAAVGARQLPGRAVPFALIIASVT